MYPCMYAISIPNRSIRAFARVKEVICKLTLVWCIVFHQLGFLCNHFIWSYIPSSIDPNFTAGHFICHLYYDSKIKARGLVHPWMKRAFNSLRLNLSRNNFMFSYYQYQNFSPISDLEFSLSHTQLDLEINSIFLLNWRGDIYCANTFRGTSRSDSNSEDNSASFFVTYKYVHCQFCFYSWLYHNLGRKFDLVFLLILLW